MKVALIGTHGTGKTALAHRIVSELKSKGINANFLGEIVRDCPLPINEQQTPPAANWIIYTQYTREIERLRPREQILICDRSVLDGYAYFVNRFGEDELLERFVREKIKEYDVFNSIVSQS